MSSGRFVLNILPILTPETTLPPPHKKTEGRIQMTDNRGRKTEEGGNAEEDSELEKDDHFFK